MRQAERESKANPELLAGVKQEPGTEAASQSSQSTSQESEPAGSQPPKKKQRKSLSHRMAGDAAQVTDLTKPAESLKKEVADYMSARSGMSPLEWWSKASFSFPNIGELAREYLCIPPTEVSVSDS